MKITKTLYLVIFITLINVYGVFGQPPEPEPEVPPPPGAAIDQSILVLLSCGLIFGMYSIYRYDLNKKASI